MARNAISDGVAAPEAPVETRILDAALRTIARRGVRRLTLDEVAREAGCGRATVYRTFPGGKREVVEAAAAHELARFFATVEPVVAATESLDDLLVAGMTAAARFAATSEPLVQLAAHEPEVILAHVAFDRVDVVFAAAEAFLRPHLERHLPTDQVAKAAEWVTRATLIYVCLPYTPLDLTDADATRHLVGTYLSPGLVPLSSPQPRS
jgi:AcrR family transcriptional regulator